MHDVRSACEGRIPSWYVKGFPFFFDTYLLDTFLFCYQTSKSAEQADGSVAGRRHREVDLLTTGDEARISAIQETAWWRIGDGQH